MRKWLKQWWRRFGMASNGWLIAEYLGKRENGADDHVYEDDRIRVGGSNESWVWVEANVKGEFVRVFQNEFWNGVTRFNDGCWVEHFNALLPAAQRARYAVTHAVQIMERKRWEPVDDCD